MLQNGGATAMTPDVVKETTTQGFMKDVIEESKAASRCSWISGRRGAARASSLRRFSKKAVKGLQKAK
jgi:hypothetical protein